MTTFLVKAAGLFGFGVLTSLTPCVYPMIPISVGYLGSETSATGEKKRSLAKIFGFVIGQVLTFTALGMLAVTLGEILGFSSELPSIQFGTGAVLIVLGYFSFREELPKFLTKWNNIGPLNNQNISWSSSSFVSFGKALFVGSLSALVASPCTSPMLGGVLTQIATEGSIIKGTFLMFLYSVGMSSIFLVLGLGLLKARTLPKSGTWLTKVHKFSALLLCLGGIYFIYQGYMVI